MDEQQPTPDSSGAAFPLPEPGPAPSPVPSPPPHPIPDPSPSPVPTPPAPGPLPGPGPQPAPPFPSPPVISGPGAGGPMFMLPAAVPAALGGPTGAHPSWVSTHSSAYAAVPAPTAGGSVPQQRASGTVYGGVHDYPEMTTPIPMSLLENSGSLTGYILAQGWSDTPQHRRGGSARVIVVMLLVLLGLVGMGMLFLFTAGDAFTRLFQGIF